MFTYELPHINYGLLAIVFFQSLRLFFKFYKLLSASKKGRNKLDLPPVSVIVSIRNEEQHLNDLVPSLLNQNYPDYKLVLINDQSRDSSLELIRAFEAKNPERIKLVNIPLELENSGKKFALSMGIKAAQTEWLIFTDADCIPSSENWLKGMMESRKKDETEIVLGMSPYKSESNFVNSMIQLETFFTAADYALAALTGKPYMGVGRNLAYTKSLWLKNQGFASHMHLRSGDDDLFIQEVANSRNTSVCLDHQAYCLSDSPKTLKSWWRQKSRHYTTSSSYDRSSKLKLGFGHIFSLFNLLAIAVLGFEYFNFPQENDLKDIVLAASFLVILQIFILWRTNRVLGFPVRLYQIIFGRIPLYILQFSILVISRITKPKHW
jgi:cellulose synthase/poly-beta-1,6-N-acetylglucosamine synthase-like glycosyltransferase